MHNFHRLQRHCDYALQKFEGISGVLIFSPKRQGGGRDVWRCSVKNGDLISKWDNLGMTFYTSKRSKVFLHLDGRKVFSNTPNWIEPCGVPHFKIGIYRLGSILGNSWLVVDFDKIILTKFRKK